MGKRADALADRLEHGAAALARFAGALTEQEWKTRLPGDGRMIGVVVHHVADVYPLEVQIAQAVASGKPIAGVTWAVVADMNAKHAGDNATVTKAAAIEHLKRNSAAAAAAVRKFSDEELDRAATVSLKGDATLTAQFVLEDHAVRHSLHHLAKMKAALGHD
jgi:hypothetical protein